MKNTITPKQWDRMRDLVADAIAECDATRKEKSQLLNADWLAEDVEEIVSAQTARVAIIDRLELLRELAAIDQNSR